jgi:hypothetical protein
MRMAPQARGHTVASTPCRSHSVARLHQYQVRPVTATWIEMCPPCSAWLTWMASRACMGMGMHRGIERATNRFPQWSTALPSHRGGRPRCVCCAGVRPRTAAPGVTRATRAVDCPWHALRASDAHAACGIAFWAHNPNQTRLSWRLPLCRRMLASTPCRSHSVARLHQYQVRPATATWVD